MKGYFAAAAVAPLLLGAVVSGQSLDDLQYDQTLSVGYEIPVGDITTVDAMITCRMKYVALPYAVDCDVGLSVDVNADEDGFNKGVPLGFGAYFGAIIESLGEETTTLKVGYGITTPSFDLNSEWVDALGLGDLFLIPAASFPPVGREYMFDLPFDFSATGLCLVENLPELVQNLDPQLQEAAQMLDTLSDHMGIDICASVKNIAIDEGSENEEGGSRMQLFVSIHLLDEDLMTANRLTRPIFIQLRKTVFGADEAIIFDFNIGKILFGEFFKQGLYIQQEGVPLAQGVIDNKGYFHLGNYAILPPIDSDPTLDQLIYDKTLAIGHTIEIIGDTEVDAMITCQLKYIALPYAVDCNVALTVNVLDNEDGFNKGIPLEFGAYFGAILRSINEERTTLEVGYGVSTPSIDLNNEWTDALGLGDLLRIDAITFPPQESQNQLMFEVPFDFSKTGLCLVENLPELVQNLDPQIKTIAASLDLLSDNMGVDVCLAFKNIELDELNDGAKMQLFLTAHFLDEKLMSNSITKKIFIQLRKQVFNSDEAITFSLNLGRLLFGEFYKKGDFITTGGENPQILARNAIQIDGKFLLGSFARELEQNNSTAPTTSPTTGSPTVSPTKMNATDAPTKEMVYTLNPTPLPTSFPTEPSTGSMLKAGATFVLLFVVAMIF